MRAILQTLGALPAPLDPAERMSSGAPPRSSALTRGSALVIAALTLACGQDAAPTEAVPKSASLSEAAADEHRHVIVFAAEALPVDLDSRLAAIGASLEHSIPQIGVAIVRGSAHVDEKKLRELPGVQFVDRDQTWTMDAAEDASELAPHVAADALARLSSSQPAALGPADALLFARQWNLRAVSVDAAWAAGYTGSSEVTVAIIDTGVDDEHPELRGLVDLSRSASFVSSDDAFLRAMYPGRPPTSDMLYHGTAVASVVASNAVQLAGMNRQVTLIAAKAADRFGAFTVSSVVGAIVFAADQGADVINMSGGGIVDKRANPGIAATFHRALNYAFSKGALFVGSTGNDAMDHDHNKWLTRFCEFANGICVSATAPTHAFAAEGPWENVDAIAPYTGFGRSIINVAAPGGIRTITPFFTAVTLPCTTTFSSTSPGSCRTAGIPVGQRLLTGAGTSWSAAHVTGLAALLVAKHGKGNPARIRALILQSADDLGEPGVDPYYGRGRINAARALGVIE